MLMDMFASSLPRDMAKGMERVHYHDFMLDVHESLQEHRATPDPLQKVAKDIAAKSSLICLDELFVSDIADATILHRLFDNLWGRDVTLITTSNRHPDHLYENGLQRQLFLPFIETIKTRCVRCCRCVSSLPPQRCRSRRTHSPIHPFTNRRIHASTPLSSRSPSSLPQTQVIHDMESDRDYRKLAHHAEGLYFTSQFREQELEERFIELTNNNPIGAITVDVEMGRSLVLHRTGGCVAYETFADLCEKPLGAADYMAVAHSKHTLALSGIPKFDEKSRPYAYRFVTLIDILYENRIRLICSADGRPEALFENIHVYDRQPRDVAPEARNSSDIVIDDNLGFVKERTISRLIEMQSNEYLVDHANRHAPELLKALESHPTRSARKR